MKKLFLELIVLACLVCVTYAGATTYVDQHFSRTNSYMAMSVVKEHRLQTIKAPRLILMGGSSVLFGVDSKLLQRRKQARVINMGLHAGLGLSFLLNESANQIGKNDTIILCPEYYITDDGINAQVELITANPKAQQYLNYNFYDLIRMYATRLQKIISIPFSYLGNVPEVPKTYAIENLNEFGDIYRCYPEDKKPIDFEEVIPAIKYDQYIAKINSFIVESNKRGAVVYFTFPALCASGYKTNRTSILALENQYKQKLHCKFLGTVTDFVYPDNYFFDSIYHLNESARTIRTKQLLKLLNEV